MFKNGEKVYHKNLKKIGIFDSYDDLDTDTCYAVERIGKCLQIGNGL